MGGSRRCGSHVRLSHASRRCVVQRGLGWEQRGFCASVANGDDAFDPWLETGSIAIGGDDGHAATGELAEYSARAGGQITEDAVQEEDWSRGSECAREHLRWRQPRTAPRRRLHIRDEVVRRHAAYLNGAGIGSQETRYAQEQRGFAAAHGTAHAEDFAGPDIEVDAVEHIGAGVAPLDAREERFPQPAND